MSRAAFSSRILKNLTSGDVLKKRAAAEALARGDERAVYPLIQALRDPHPGVQDAALGALISIGGEVTAWMVLPLLREKASLRNMAMVILKEIGSSTLRHLPPLLRDKDGDIRKFAVELSADLGGHEFAGKIVELLKGDPNPNVRGAAAKALGDLRRREALPHLVAALKDMEWVRFAALKSLCSLGDEEAVAPIQALLDDSSFATRRFAIEALGAIGSPLAGKALLTFLKKAEGADRRAVLTSLLKIGIPLPDDGYPEDLLEIFLADDNEWEDRIIALRGLIGIAGRNALGAIFDKVGALDATNPTDEEILSAIKEILLDCGHPELLPDMLEDPTLRFRGKSILAELVGNLRLREAVGALVARLGDDARDVRRAAAYALGRIRDDEALEGLLGAIGDHDSYVRKAIVSALGALGKKEAFSPLMSLLQEEQHFDVIDEAVRALFAIDPEAMRQASGSLGERARSAYDAFVRGDMGLGVTEECPDDPWK